MVYIFEWRSSWAIFFLILPTLGAGSRSCLEIQDLVLIVHQKEVLDDVVVPGHDVVLAGEVTGQYCSSSVSGLRNHHRLTEAASHGFRHFGLKYLDYYISGSQRGSNDTVTTDCRINLNDGRPLFWAEQDCVIIRRY